MNIIYASLLGILQGLTEFLPVSSSGHLAIVQKLIPSFSQPGVLFDVILHFGTVIAVLVFFRKKILEIISKDKKYIGYLIIGTIPAVLIGFLFRDLLEGLFSNIKLIGFGLIITGILNLLIDKVNVNKKELTIKNSLLIGIAQAIAIIPGISRSGSTIFAGSRLGIKKEKAAEFSFLLSVPAVVGANLLEIVKYGKIGIENFGVYSLGFIASFVSGFLAIGLAIKLLNKSNFKTFAYYCFAVGILVIIFL